MRIHAKSILYSAGILWLALAASLPAFSDTATRQLLDETYARVLRDPQNRALTLEYAAIAMQLKDYEAAIPPLERILLNEPGNAKIKLQVGLLYQSLGSDMMAKQYFADAAATPGAPANVVSEAQEYLHVK